MMVGTTGGDLVCDRESIQLKGFKENIRSMCKDRANVFTQKEFEGPEFNIRVM